MNRAYRLFSVRGIDVKLHVTFPLILILAAMQFGLVGGGWAGALFGVAAVSLLFVLVTLHELGHSLAAQHYHIEVKQIVLSPLGGVAQLAEMPENPRHELIIAAAGPAVNFAIAALMLPVLPLVGATIGVPAVFVNGGVSLGPGALVSYVFFYNILLALFNLLPAFPLDGGRILRALLAMRMDYVRATNLAARVGRAAAVLLGLYGLLSGGITTALIAMFIYIVAGQEAAYVRYRRALSGYTVGQVYTPSVLRLSPVDTIQQAANLMLVSRQTDFPVVVNERLVGFVPHVDLLQAMRSRNVEMPVSQIMHPSVEPVIPSDELFEVGRRMEAQHLGALPVVVGGNFIGLVSKTQIDMLRQMVMTSPQTAPRPRVA